MLGLLILVVVLGLLWLFIPPLSSPAERRQLHQSRWYRRRKPAPETWWWDYKDDPKWKQRLKNALMVDVWATNRRRDRVLPLLRLALGALFLIAMLDRACPIINAP